MRPPRISIVLKFSVTCKSSGYFTEKKKTLWQQQKSLFFGFTFLYSPKKNLTSLELGFNN